MRILGIDTSLRSTGYGIIDISPTGEMKVIDCGTRLHKAIRQLLDIYKPQEVSIEGTFYGKYAKTAMILGMARGAALSALSESDIPAWEYAPKRAKQAITGSGNSSKHQVATVIAAILKADISQINDDATDALALAVCHAQASLSPMPNKLGTRL